MRAIVDEDACTGCGLCADNCPEVFELNDDGIAMVLLDPVPPASAEAAREAADTCPVDAIEIEE